MHWIVAANMYDAPVRAQIQALLAARGLPHTMTTYVPFAGTLDPTPVATNPIAVLGSTTVVAHALAQGWGPGVFSAAEIDVRRYAPIYGEAYLNYGARILPLGDVQLQAPAFIRPTNDAKDFPGTVVSPARLSAWRERIVDPRTGSTASRDTLVVVAPLQDIRAEYRCFVVDGRLVTSSRYREHGALRPQRGAPPTVLAAAEAMIRQWQPACAFVIDLAETPQGVKLIEFGCINAAGWYDADLGAIIDAITAIAA